MRQAEASANIDEMENLIYPDGDGSEIAAELREKEYRLKKLQEAKEVLEKERLEKVNGTRLSADEGQPGCDPARLQWPDSG
jgi:hypothetical protein